MTPFQALWLLAERRWRGPTLLLAPTVKAMACATWKLWRPKLLALDGFPKLVGTFYRTPQYWMVKTRCLCIVSRINAVDGQLWGFVRRTLFVFSEG